MLSKEMLPAWAAKAAWALPFCVKEASKKAETLVRLRSAAAARATCSLSFLILDDSLA